MKKIQKEYLLKPNSFNYYVDDNIFYDETKTCIEKTKNEILFIKLKNNKDYSLVSKITCNGITDYTEETIDSKDAEKNLKKQIGNAITLRSYVLTNLPGNENNFKFNKVYYMTYTDALKGMKTIKINFETAEDASNFIWPSYFQADITNDKFFKTENLINYTYCDVKSYIGNKLKNSNLTK